MRHYQAKVSAEGQLTIPAAIREYFGLKTGDIVDFYVDDAGALRQAVGSEQEHF